jgi:arrestin-related trafficking adapter 3/6
MVPGNTPPTLECPYGNVTWRLKGQVHRPGTFSHKLSALREVILIASPGEDDTEDTENIIIERQWDGQLQYLISISGRSFYIGGTLPIQITILPMAKMKFHRFSVILEGKRYAPWVHVLIVLTLN